MDLMDVRSRGVGRSRPGRGARGGRGRGRRGGRASGTRDVKVGGERGSEVRIKDVEKALGEAVEDLDMNTGERHVTSDSDLKLNYTPSVHIVGTSGTNFSELDDKEKEKNPESYNVSVKNKRQRRRPAVEINKSPFTDKRQQRSTNRCCGPRSRGRPPKTNIGNPSNQTLGISLKHPSDNYNYNLTKVTHRGRGRLPNVGISNPAFNKRVENGNYNYNLTKVATQRGRGRPPNVGIANAAFNKSVKNVPKYSTNLQSSSLSQEGATKVYRARKEIDISNPVFLKPFDHGWRREIVIRSTPQSNKPSRDVYYYCPRGGKKLRSPKEIAHHLSETDLTLENFTFVRESLGLNDPKKELIRESRLNLRNKNSSASTLVREKSLHRAVAETPEIVTHCCIPPVTLTPLDTSPTSVVPPQPSQCLNPHNRLMDEAPAKAGPSKAPPPKNCKDGSKTVISQGDKQDECERQEECQENSKPLKKACVEERTSSNISKSPEVQQTSRRESRSKNKSAEEITQPTLQAYTSSSSESQMDTPDMDQLAPEPSYLMPVTDEFNNITDNNIKIVSTVFLKREKSTHFPANDASMSGGEIDFSDESNNDEIMIIYEGPPRCVNNNCPYVKQVHENMQVVPSIPFSPEVDTRIASQTTVTTGNEQNERQDEAETSKGCGDKSQSSHKSSPSLGQARVICYAAPKPSSHSSSTSSSQDMSKPSTSTQGEEIELELIEPHAPFPLVTDNSSLEDSGTNASTASVNAKARERKRQRLMTYSQERKLRLKKLKRQLNILKLQSEERKLRIKDLKLNICKKSKMQKKTDY